jgi:hypothetical protein
MVGSMLRGMIGVLVQGVLGMLIIDSEGNVLDHELQVTFQIMLQRIFSNVLGSLYNNWQHL